MYLIFLWCCFIICGVGPVQAETGIHGLWVVRHSLTSRSKVEEVVRCAAAHGYNILFIQVRGRGDAYYRSSLVAGPEEYPHIPESFDPLETLIELAHAQGIEVHAWLNTYLVWSSKKPPSDPRHVVNAHPEWFMVSEHGMDMACAPMDSILDIKTEGRYLSPGHDGVRHHMTSIVTELVEQYDIDGVHLDYIRYPGQSYDFSPRERERFSRRFGIDPLDVVQNGGDVDSHLNFFEKWLRYKSSLIDRQLVDISEHIKSNRRRIRLSAAVKPDTDEAFYVFGQDWAGWLDKGLLDFVVVMSYFQESVQIARVLENSLFGIDRSRVVGGIGAYLLTPQETAGQIELMHNMGLLGFSIFSYTTFEKNETYAETLDSFLVSRRE